MTAATAPTAPKGRLFARVSSLILTASDDEVRSRQPQLKNSALFWPDASHSHAFRTSFMSSTTAIQPVMLPGAARCLAASRQLLELGFWVSAIRHPTVPAGTERLRVTMTPSSGKAIRLAEIKAFAGGKI